MLRTTRSMLVVNGVAILIFGAAALVLWPELLTSLFRTAGFEPHGYCFLWDPGLVSLHLSSDVLIGLAYTAIGVTLAYLVHRARRDIPFHWILVAFGTFIVACGGTHFMEVWTLWTPVYWLSGAVKALTAAASVATALALPPLVPRALRLIDTAKLSEQRKLNLETTNRELAILYEKSKELDRLKTQFFANVSHELRTPLTLILGPTQKLLGEEGLSSAQRHDLEVIERNARILLNHVNDLLDVAKLEAGKMEISYTEVDLARLVRTTASSFETLAQEKRIAYSVETPPSVPAQADPEKLQRVFANLLGNAFKFTPSGGSVTCVLHTQDGRATIAVQDNGPGVPSEQREAIFERFHQGDGGANRHFQGTGLGLSIVREFVELHGGTVTVADAPGGGALFRVEVPLAAPRGATVERAAMAPGAVTDSTRHVVEQLRPPVETARDTVEATGQALVLVVEDNPDMNRFIADTLATDYRVATAADGEAGLAQALALRPNLIVSDMMMPRMSGDELLRAVRAHPELAGIPVVLLTAKAGEELRVQWLRAGAQDYLVKPFSVEELRARVSNLIAMQQAREVLQQQLASQSENVAVLANEARDAIRTRDEFLSIASHELKTPITALLGYTQVLQRRFERERPANERDQRALRVIVEQGERLNRLIGALLDLSRIQTGRFSIERRPVDLCELARRVVEQIEAALPEHRVELACAEEPLIVDGDELRLEQVFYNLLQNAAKYSPAGSPIAVSIERQDGSARIAVRDQGIGIPEEAQAHIFERFYRAGNIDSANISGFGIGLYVVKEIVTHHGGQVGVASVEGHGSTFTVSLPLAARSEENDTPIT